VNNVITTGGLPASITYTITGSDSATGMSSCNNKVFYLTVLTCNGATVNSPCVGDSLLFNAPGDSTGATYVWFGPAPSTAVFGTTQKVFKYPAAITDTGTYTVVKSVGGVPVDTATTTAVIHPLPTIAVTTPGMAHCGPFINPLVLNATPDVACDSFNWIGPNGFTSTVQNPSVFGFDSTGQGNYHVFARSTYGCKNTADIPVWGAVTIKYDTLPIPKCPYDTALLLNNTTYNANIYDWNFGDGTPHVGVRNPVLHSYSAGHTTYTITMTATNSASGCTATRPEVVDLRHDVTADFNIPVDTICNQSAVTINDASSAHKWGATVSPLYSYFIEFGDGTSDVTAGPSWNHTYPQEGKYEVQLTVMDSLNCTNVSEKKNVYVLQPYIRMVGDTTFCLTQPLPVYNTEWEPTHYADNYPYTYSWAPVDGNLSSSTDHVPMFNAIGTFVYTLTATLTGTSFACPVSHTVTLTSILPSTLHNVTQSIKIKLGESVNLNADSEMNYTWTPNDGSLNNNDISNPVATPTVTTTYTVFGMDKYGCRDTAYLTIIVDSTQTEIIPTGFTPNGDGKNDVFHVGGTKFQNLVEMRIFNRYGECVFQTRDKDQGWDGTYKGVPQDIGTYNYTVIVARPGYGDNVVYKGTITLIR
jgi:gliding motility-associated-like protein